MKKKILFLLFGLLIFIGPQISWAFKVAVITDIHAGGSKVRNRSTKIQSNIVHPRWYKGYLTKVIRGIKASGISTVIVTGDITNNDSTRYSNKVKAITKKSGLAYIWVKGNHEGKKTTKIFLPQGNNYYYQDLNNWRFIILNSNENFIKSSGFIGPVQYDWISQTIESSPYPVVVAMHHPIFNISLQKPDEILSGYQDLEKIFSESGKVKYVLAGHVHVTQQFSKELNGVQYFVNSPLTIKGNPGTFQILDLPENSD